MVIYSQQNVHLLNYGRAIFRGNGSVIYDLICLPNQAAIKDNNLCTWIDQISSHSLWWMLSLKNDNWTIISRICNNIELLSPEVLKACLNSYLMKISINAQEIDYYFLTNSKKCALSYYSHNGESR